MSNVIMNDTGNGFIKDYTHNLKLVIPYFDIATWHDYIEYNFDTLDAVINHIYKIVGFVGEWKKTTTYNAEEIVYINDKNSQYYTRLAKILVNHTTNSNDFDTFYAEHEDYYEIYTENIQTNGIRIVNINDFYSVNPQENITIDLSQYTYPNKNYYCVVNFDSSVDLTTISSYCYYTSNTQNLIIHTHNTQSMTVLINFVLLIPIDKSFDSTNFVYGYTNGLYMQDKLIRLSEFTQEIERVIGLIPTVYNATLNIKRNSVSIGTFTANSNTNKDINIIVPTQASDVHALPDSVKYAASVALSINSSTYVITLQLKDQDGNNIGSAQTIDLPLESVVVGGEYNAQTQSIILTLDNGNTITIPVSGLISGLQTTANLVTSVSSLSTNDQYPSAKLFYDTCGDIETLINAL